MKWLMNRILASPFTWEALLILFSSKSYAQVITEKQVQAYSDKLVEYGFLTVKGQGVLLEKIKQGKIEVDQPSTVRAVTYSRDMLSKETILKFCQAAITTELMSRLHKNGMHIEEKISPKEPLNELLKSAMKENKVDGDIYYCIDNGQEAGYIFLTAEQYQFVKETYSDLFKERYEGIIFSG